LKIGNNTGLELIFVITMQEIGLTEIVEKYRSYYKYRRLIFYAMTALTLASFFIYPMLATAVFLLFFFGTYLSNYYINIQFYKWIYQMQIKPERLLHSYVTKKFAESTYTVRNCIRWAFPADKELLRTIKRQIEDIPYPPPSFAEQLFLESEYIIYHETGSGLRMILFILAFCLLVSYSNAGQKYLLKILLIAGLLLIPATINYYKRKNNPYLIISTEGIEKKGSQLVKWAEISTLSVEDDSDSETTSVKIVLELRSGIDQQIDITDILYDQGLLEIILKKFLRNSQSTKR